MGKNCTTVFDSFTQEFNDLYFFRLNCPRLKYTFNDGVNITAQSDPSPPLLTDVNQVSEGVQMRLQCSVPVPCSILPPSLTWILQNNSRQEHTQMQQNVDGQMTMTSTVTFIASADHHNQTVACSVSYPLTEGGSTPPSATARRLDVLYAPRFTVVTLSTSGPVSEGRVVMFTCSSDANPPVSLYTWYRVDAGQLTKKGEGEMLVLQVSQRDSRVYLCEAQTQRGSQRSRPVTLDVNSTTGSTECVVAIPYIICGVVLVLYILTSFQEAEVIHDSTPCLLHLLLLAELFAHSSSRPAHSLSLCGMFASMIPQVDRLMNLSKKLHDLTDEELVSFDGVENRLDGLPHIQFSADYFRSLKVNESLSQLYVFTQSFRLHVDWLQTAKRNVGLSSQSAEGASTHLLQLSNLLNASLHQISEEVPQSPSPSLPVVSTAFDVLQFSVEISEQLQAFCNWSKRVLRILRKLSPCHKH
ncbi:uncharacterized protein [Enoplosus armatus]|uniref:uncharacterized protein n=1 Tax=Enoplosus armatus TaxID=215367 RepID=UPI0039967AB6